MIGRAFDTESGLRTQPVRHCISNRLLNGKRSGSLAAFAGCVFQLWDGIARHVGQPPRSVWGHYTMLC